MRKTIYFTSFFLLLITINPSYAVFGCFKSNQNQAIPTEEYDLKTNQLSKAFIAVFFYKADKSSTEVNDEKAGTSDIQEQTKKEKEHRIIFFTKTGKPIEGDNIHSLTAKLNISAGELKQHPDKAEIVFKNNSEHLSDEDKEDFKKGNIEIVYINNLEQILSKDTNTREQIKKLLKIEDKKFTGKGSAGPQTILKLKNLGIYVELTNRESIAMKGTVENLIKNRKEKYASDQAPGTITGTETGASTSKEEIPDNE